MREKGYEEAMKGEKKKGQKANHEMRGGRKKIKERRGRRKFKREGGKEDETDVMSEGRKTRKGGEEERIKRRMMKEQK